MKPKMKASFVNDILAFFKTVLCNLEKQFYCITMQSNNILIS